LKAVKKRYNFGKVSVNTKLSLRPIDRDGTIRGYSGSLPEVVSQVAGATRDLYARAGFEEPWIGYVALADDTVVGTCGYKARPQDGRVEIAYFTFPEFEGRGYASAMAARLLAIAQEHDSSLVVAAQTLPERNASHRVLEKLGFQHVDTIDDPEDGKIWEWQFQKNDVCSQGHR
jgi:ribosomal-protein-alanine N-acetyltransferase